MDCGIALTAAGAAFELLGLVLIAWEIRNNRRQAEVVLSAPIVKTVGKALEVSSAIKAHATGGREPTTEERVAHLEQEVAELRHHVDESLGRERREREERVAETLSQAEDRSIELDRRTRHNLRDVLVGNVRLRVTGLVLFMVGVALQTVGNIVLA
jgi:hypothetical protein